MGPKQALAAIEGGGIEPSARTPYPFVAGALAGQVPAVPQLRAGGFILGAVAGDLSRMATVRTSTKLALDCESVWSYRPWQRKTFPFFRTVFQACTRRPQMGQGYAHPY